MHYDFWKGFEILSAWTLDEKCVFIFCFLCKIWFLCNFQSKHIFNKKLFDLAEILHAGQPIQVDVFENRNFENSSRFVQDMIFFQKTV